MPFHFPIETARLLIRPYTAADIDKQIEAVRESVATVGRWLAWCTPDYSAQQAADWFASCAEAMAEGDAFTFGLFDKASQQLVGSICINQLKPDMQIGNIGYWVRESRQGLGYAREAVQAITRFGFETLKLLRLEIVAALDNLPSNRVALRCGGRLEHVDKQGILLGSGYVAANVYVFLPGQKDRLSGQPGCRPRTPAKKAPRAPFFMRLADRGAITPAG